MSDVPIPGESSPLGNNEPTAEPLRRWERVAALIVGLVAGVVGGCAVFKSGNQAGTAALLVIATVFLLIGVQGTSLIRFASGSNSVEMERRRRNVAQALALASEEDSSERALGIVEGAAIAEPRLVQSWVLYERRVANAVMLLGYLADIQRVDSVHFDLRIQNESGQSIYAELKYYSSGRYISTDVVRSIAGLTATMAHSVPVVLISNTSLTKSARALASRLEFLSYVLWDGERDNERLSETLRTAFAKIGPTG